MTISVNKSLTLYQKHDRHCIRKCVMNINIIIDNNITAVTRKRRQDSQGKAKIYN